MTILLSAETARADDLPPLYLFTFLPFIAKNTLPVFPPCECPPNDPTCVC
jgi:hypothetical protein